MYTYNETNYEANAKQIVNTTFSTLTSSYGREE